MRKKQRKGNTFSGAFVGLDPNAFPLANHHCKDCNTAFSSNAGSFILCPECGSVAEKQNGKVSASTLETFKFQTCPTCTSELHTNMEPEVIASVGEVFCPECGQKIVIAQDELPVIDDELEEEDSEDLDVLEEEEWSEDEEDEEGFIEAEVVSEEDLEEEEDLDDEDDDEEDEEDEDEDDDEDEDEELEEVESNALALEIASILKTPLTSASALSMDLHEIGDDLVRNVIISGTPVARIHLSDQKNAADLQHVFSQDVYVDALAENMLAKPPQEVLEDSDARIFTDLGSQDTPTEDQVEAAVTERMNTFRKRFKETFLAVLSGTNKNLFPDVHNSLKESLWESLASEGVEEPEKIIEPIFEDAAEEFLDQTFDKTVNLMEKEEPVRQEILQMVAEAGVQKVSSTKNMDPGMVRALKRDSMPVAMGNINTNFRASLRDRIRLNAR